MADTFDIDIQAMADSAADQAAEEMLEEISKESFVKLQQAIKQLVAALYSTQETADLFEKQARLKRKFRSAFNTTPAEIDRAIDELKQSSYNINQGNKVQDLIASALNFQTVLNECINQQISMVYVVNIDGEPEVFTHSGNIPVEQLGKYVDTTHRIINMSKNLLGESVKVDPKQQEKLYKALERLKIIYKEVRWRAETHPTKKGPLIMWYLGRWNLYWASGIGDINEAYGAFFMALINAAIDTMVFNNGIEEGVGEFVQGGLNKGLGLGMMAVDNSPGLLEGDWSYNGVEYAIKGGSLNSSKAKTAGLQPFIQALTQIQVELNRNGKITVGLIKKIKSVIQMKGAHVQQASAAVRKKFLQEKPNDILNYANGGRGTGNWLTLYSTLRI